MLIREYNESDLDALRAMHASQGFDYPFPDLADPIFVSKLVLENDSGRPVMAALARLTCEMYLLLDRADTDHEEAGGANTMDGQKRDSSGQGAPLRMTLDPTCQPERSEGALGQMCSFQEDQGIVPRSRQGRANPRQRYEWLLALHAAGERDLFARGLDDAHAWLPPQIAKRFGRRLEALGWVRDDAWTPYCRKLTSSG